jgi:hypothetical protein
MNPNLDVSGDIVGQLRSHLAVCRELLAAIEQESQALRQGEENQGQAIRARKGLLPRLVKSLDDLRVTRARWQKLSPTERDQQGPVPALLRQNQELIMKILVLDRENEQLLLRKGLVPPQHLPSLNRQRPHYVANLYQRSQGANVRPSNAD